MAEDDPVVQWLLEGDPAIRWQVLRDLLNASETEVTAERARVEHEGWGARLLALQAPDGQWAGGAYVPGTAEFAAATAELWLPVSHRHPSRRPTPNRPTGRTPNRASRGPRHSRFCSTCAIWAHPRRVR